MGITILFSTFILCLIIGVPVAICLGVSSVAYLVFYADIPLVVFPQKIFAGVDSFVLLCIPGFIMAGSLMNGGGITDRIIRFAVRGMLPKNRLTERYLENLKVYAGPEHPHQGQNPQPFEME